MEVTKKLEGKVAIVTGVQYNSPDFVGGPGGF
jgi:hypothetical protein